MNINSIKCNTLSRTLCFNSYDVIKTERNIFTLDLYSVFSAMSSRKPTCVTMPGYRHKDPCSDLDGLFRLPCIPMGEDKLLWGEAVTRTAIEARDLSKFDPPWFCCNKVWRNWFNLIWSAYILNYNLHSINNQMQTEKCPKKKNTKVKWICLCVCVKAECLLDAFS